MPPGEFRSRSRRALRWAVTAIGTGGDITIYNSGPSAVDVIADLSGTYFTYSPN